MAGHLLFNSGSNESSLAPPFKWLDNTFKGTNGIFNFYTQCIRCYRITVTTPILKGQSHQIG
jgi:hypothetical protein